MRSLWYVEYYPAGIEADMSDQSFSGAGTALAYIRRVWHERAPQDILRVLAPAGATADELRAVCDLGFKPV
jgi:hypothetical protein